MKKALTVAAVLTWFNIIFWGIVIALALLGMLATGQMAYVVGLVLLSSIPLNCYAALKLHTSIRYPNVPLSHQTPAGIRFVGLMAMFFGFLLIFEGAVLLSDPKPGLDIFQQFTDQLSKPIAAKVSPMGLTFARVLAVGWLLLGVFVAVNVVLNLRLLRWYYLVHKSKVS